MKNKMMVSLGLLLIISNTLLSQKWVSIFNGKDLSGWTNNGYEKWYVENHELICESGPEKEYGYLSTNKSYKNFILTLQFKQEANGNSGVFFRSSIDGIKISGWQAEIAPPSNHTGGIYESYGRGWLALPTSEGEKALKYGKWNTYLIEVQGNHVTTTLNGQRIVDLTDEKIGQGEGFIALQIHDGGGIRLRWKNIKIKEYK